MVIDIGGGTTDIAVLSLGGIVVSKSLKIAGNVFDSDIKEYIKSHYRLLIGDKTAAMIKHEIGSVYDSSDESEMEVRGRDLESGLPSIITINSLEVEEALKKDIDKIILATKAVLEDTPPELSADIIENGAVLTGGGSLIKGLKELFEEELQIPIYLAESPLTSVAEGTGIMLENLSLLN